jgi:adenylate cyclase
MMFVVGKAEAAVIRAAFEQGGVLATARRAVRDYPDYPLSYRYLAASLGQLGRIDEARVALQQAMTISPATFDLYVRSRQPWVRPEDYEHMLDGLRKAGWQG